MQYKPMLSPDVPVDLSNCDREPIHAPSLSQPHGVDLAARISDMRIGEARLKAIVDNVHADVGGWDLDLLTGKVFLSPAIRRIFGIHEGYVLTLDSVSNLFVPEDRPALGVAVRESIANGIGFDMENRLIRGDGTPIWVRSVGSVEYADGKPVRLSGAFQDITARVGERHELERTRERLGLAVESGAIGIWDFDISSNELIWDSRMYQIYGRHSEVDTRKPCQFWAGHLYPEDRDAVQQALRDGIEGIKPYDTEFRIVWDNGSLHYIKATGKVIRDQNGVALRMVGTNSDITERRQTEEDLRISTENIEMLFRGVKDYANLMLDLEGRVITWNASAENIKGYPAEDILGSHFSKFYTPEDLAIDKPAQELLAATKVGRSEDTGWRVRKDGSRFWANVVITPLFDARGKHRGYGQVTRDITALKIAEDALLQAATERKAAQDAKEANRAKSDFLANMSHEIRTPMNAIMGMTYLALAADPVPEQKVFLTKISNAADSLLSIINDILDISKMEANKMEVENIPFILQDVLNNVSDVTALIAREKGIALLFPYPPETPLCLQGDPLRLGQILINLVNNAVKFTLAGEVIVKVEARAAAGDTVRINFSVSDTGIGMSAAQVSRLFQSFNQADASTTRKYGGTGLGLAISKQLCELMGANLQVESELGKGSTFSFAVIFNKATALRASTDRLLRDELKNKSVLVVDDSEHARDVMVAMLNASGFVAKVAISGEEALSLLVDASAAGKPFDLVLLDWKMPGLNGMEVSHQIKTQLTLSHTPAILIISAFEREEVMGRGGAIQDADRLLVKPVTEAILVDTIAAIFGVEGSGKESPSPITLADQAAALAGRRVLLVEDNEINVDLATALLERLGIVVTVAMNGREGVDRVAAEPFDLVLMDIQMPVMDGLSATRLIRANSRYRTLPILAMTAHAMSGDRERSLAAGMDDHFTKPINARLLTKFLLRYMPPKPAAQAGTDKPPKNPELPQGGLPEKLPPFDMRAAMERAGDPALLRKMLLKFYGQYGDAATKLRAHLAAGRQEDAVRLVHSLKGIAATLEARDLAAAARAMEPALRTGQTADLGPLIDTVEKALGLAIAAAATLDRRALSPKARVPATAKARPRILVVDDDAMNIDLFTGLFSGDYEVLSATEGTKALEIARRASPDLVLLDVMMPGIDGYEVCRRLLADPRTSAIPVIFVTSNDDVDSEAKGVGLGAVDYITKPINAAKVKARVDNQIKLKWEREKTAQVTAEENRLRIDDEIKRGAAIDQLNKQELKLKDEFLSHVSHELRSPLTAIYSFTTIIVDGLAGETNEEQNEYLAIILKNVRQLQAMVEDLLQVTQSATGKLSIDLQSVPVRGVVLDALHTMQGAAAAKIISFSYDLADDLASAYADPMRLVQILIILMDNAVKFTPVCGKVKVQAGISSKAPGFLLFEVSDSGCGIDPEKARSIFEHLYQITDTGQAGRKGLGLGLHIAKDLVIRQGGEIWVESKPPNGSQFFFTIPIYRGHV